MIEIEEENSTHKPRIVIYGIECIGKTTFAANTPNPIFICSEDGASLVRDKSGNKVKRMKKDSIRLWSQVMERLRELINKDHDYQTLVIDSADWLEKKCHKQIIGDSHLDIIKVHGGYGAGLRRSEKMHNELIELLEVLRTKKDMNIVVIAHNEVRKVNDPTVGIEFDSHKINCDNRVANLWMQWADIVGFATRAYRLEGTGDTGNTGLMQKGKRVIYFEETAAFRAKTRYSKMPKAMEFIPTLWDKLEKYFDKGDENSNEKNDREDEELIKIKELKLSIKELIDYDCIGKDVLKKALEIYRSNDIKKLQAAEKRLKEIIKESESKEESKEFESEEKTFEDILNEYKGDEDSKEGSFYHKLSDFRNDILIENHNKLPLKIKEEIIEIESKQDFKLLESIKERVLRILIDNNKKRVSKKKKSKKESKGSTETEKEFIEDKSIESDDDFDSMFKDKKKE